MKERNGEDAGKIRGFSEKMAPYLPALYPLTALPYSLLLILSGLFFSRGLFSGSMVGAVWLLIYVLMGGTAYVADLVWAFDKILSSLPRFLQRQRNGAESRVLWYLLYLILCYGCFCQVGTKTKALMALGMGFVLCRCFYILYIEREKRPVVIGTLLLGIVVTALMAMVSWAYALCLLDVCIVNLLVFCFFLEKKIAKDREGLGRYYLCGTDFIIIWVAALLTAFLPV